ncbi:hypothetical protein FQA47_011608 [Oryzias melastigma]|uniref:Uncharacterized protein n=1 Tax=Oryzias melastigma TaxID=30732 RepID=A0A834F8K3_ORYME|nr:hypothetical protein FQA47_011608 [Oryzias melastigma]
MSVLFYVSVTFIRRNFPLLLPSGLQTLLLRLTRLATPGPVSPQVDPSRHARTRLAAPGPVSHKTWTRLTTPGPVSPQVGPSRHARTRLTTPGPVSPRLDPSHHRFRRI